ncbi:MAG: hypothetical protein PHQ08_00760 [Candidatus Pacebacteria bacterium]|nr:hypothetical protein [Candidatus Paceibacterota bacterium]
MAQPSLCVFGKRIHIVFALPKGDVEHELSLSRVFIPKLRKFKRSKSTAVQEIDYLSAINRIARQSVGVPRQNSVCFAMFNAREHIVENEAARNFGALLFNKFFNDFQLFLSRKGAQFCDLRFNTQNLFILHIGGLAGV